MSQTKAQLVSVEGGVGNGTAALPALTGDDTDTGISFGTNEVSVSTSGSERFRFGSAGQIGIGGATYGTSGQVLTSGGASAAPSWAAAGNLTRGSAVNTTSGTSIDFTGIPSGVRRIELLLDQVSISTGDTCLVQLGDSGGFETSGYDYSSGFTHTGNHGTSAYTIGFGIRWEAPECNRSGIMEIVNLTGNVWVARHLFDTNSSAQSSGLSLGAGRKELSAELTQIRLTTVAGTATFDNGQANIIYEV